MGPAILIGGLALLLFLAVSSKPPEKRYDLTKPGIPPLPDSKSSDVREQAVKKGDDKLHTTADILREAERREVRIPTNPEPPADLDKVKPEAWKEYVKKSVRGTTGARSATGAMGTYQMSHKALASIGWLSIAPDGNITWKRPGMTTAKFLADPAAQYEAFAEFTRADLSRLDASSIGPLDYVKNHVVLAGQHCTLSGLLGLTYYAGIANVERWLKDQSFRDRSPKLTEQYKRFNGIF